MNSTKKIFLVTLLISLAVLFSIEAVVLYGYHSLTRKNTYQATTFVVPEGASLISVIHQLKQQGLINHELFIKSYLHFRKLPLIVKAGEYDLSGSYSLLDLLEKFRNGDFKKYNVRFIEGMTFDEMLKVIQTQKNITLMVQGYSNQDLMQKLGLSGNPEGLFFPDTYFYSGETTDLQILKRAYDKMQALLTEEWKNRASGLPYKTSYDALIMASIIEKEAHLPQEQPIIAGVFIRRLEKGMKLQTDPTVIYGIGKYFNGNLTRADLLTDTAYNTYTRYGLPPTPIAAPGKSAIHAALHPTAGTALYFVAKGDGSHYFSSTLEEHDKAIRKYQLLK